MSDPKQLANRFREVFLNGKRVAYINVNSVLSDVTFEEALTPIRSLNTIALLTFHINYYLAGVLQVLEGGTLDIKDKYSFDMPPMNTNNEWKEMRNKLLINAEKFAQHIDVMTSQQLSSNFVKEEYGDYLLNINMMIEHTYYHLGQIAIIKKMIRESN